MTATTAPDVIEGIDMDAVPVCDDDDGCDNAAVLRLLWTCKCAQSLSCMRCWQEFATYIGQEAVYRSTFPCSGCDHVDYGVRSVSDLVRVTPL